MQEEFDYKISVVRKLPFHSLYALGTLYCLLIRKSAFYPLGKYVLIPAPVEHGDLSILWDLSPVSPEEGPAPLIILRQFIGVYLKASRVQVIDQL